MTRAQVAAEPRILIVYATRAGSTEGVAQRIATVLRDARLRVAVRRAGPGVDAAAYDAVILGSPVYDGRWLEEADAFARRSETVLVERSTWLFSVGTFGDDRRLLGRVMRHEPRDIDALRAALRPRDYRVFAGVVDRSTWPLPARLLFHAFGGRFGDRRDWEAIDAWARSIAAELLPAGGSARAGG